MGPQLRFEAVPDDEAATKASIEHSRLGGPGDIVKRLGYQFELPRSDFPEASPSARMSERPGLNTGEIG